jgi:hypothetical protein
MTLALWNFLTHTTTYASQRSYFTVNATGSMLDWLVIIAYIPTLAGILMYVIRLEVRITKMSTDICWIKGLLKKDRKDRAGEFLDKQNQCRPL